MVRIFIALLLAIPALAHDWYLFTSFRKNGETGVYFALSRDGRKWTPLNNNQPWIKPEQPGMLMRDPFLGQGPDGTWHMLWTWGWTKGQSGQRLKLGHTTSRDLITWTPQQEILVLDQEPQARNAWAPEAVWDAQRSEWVIFWATTIPGRSPSDDQSGESAYNHRIYSMTTRDWRSHHCGAPRFLLACRTNTEASAPFAPGAGCWPHC